MTTRRLTTGLVVLVALIVSVRTSAQAPVPAKPAIGAWGFDIAGMDRSVDAGEDFFRYANGAWMRATEIPADRSQWGLTTALGDTTEQRVRALVEAAAAAPAAAGPSRQVGDYFASYMDEAAIEARGIAPLTPLLDEVAAIATPVQLARFIGAAPRKGVVGPVRAAVGVDPKDNTRYAVMLQQGGLGLPDRDYYLDEQNPRFKDARAKYVQHIATLLALAGVPMAETRAPGIVALERKIAEVHWSRERSRERDLTYNPVTRDQLPQRYPGLAWDAFLEGAGVTRQAPLISRQPSAIEGAARLISGEPLAVWKDYLTSHTIRAFAPVLPKAFVDEDFAFNGRTLTGTPAISDRWRRGVTQVNAALGEAVGQVYVAKYFPPEAKAKVDRLVRNLIAAMDQRLQRVPWMTADTRTKARRKLGAFTAKIGYPDKWRDYSSLRVVRGDALGNLQRSREFEYREDFAKIGRPVDRGEWSMTPQTVNAYANGAFVEVVFPAAILQPPFFDPGADDAVNYGAIGAVIGHEISHHFDDQGRKYDARGMLADWWAAEDIQRFKGHADVVVRQYGEYEVLPGTRVNGQLTLGENIADIAGLIVAHDAYRLSLSGKPAPVLDGFSGDQRFFLSYAQLWRRKIRDEALLRLVTTDTHTPASFRGYAMRNLDAWYEAFGVRPGTRLYLPPEQRVRVW